MPLVQQIIIVIIIFEFCKHKDIRERKGQREGRMERGREAGRKEGRYNECPNQKLLFRGPPTSNLVSTYPRAPFQLGSQVLKPFPTLEGQLPASRLPSLSSERALGCH